MSWKQFVLQSLEKALGTPVELISTSPVGGGDINEAFRFDTSEGLFFVKKNSASRFPGMFEKEARGLQLLADAKEIPVPKVISHDEVNDTSYLILKFIEGSRKAAGFWDDFGRRLALLHKHSSDYFGLDHNNYIGSLVQSNRKHLSWTDFFREERLNAQVKLARNTGKLDKGVVSSFERFYNKLDEIFPVEPPALVHGDLWGGNFMVNENGVAVIIDPAIYYGNREMDIGMSMLFGGFSNEFYELYNQHYPLQPEWRNRIEYCNLYPLMVHVNLFGGGYLNSVNTILRQF